MKHSIQDLVGTVFEFQTGERWAVRKNSMCLARSAEWEYEPRPSCRDKAFYARCRFDTLEQAFEVYQKSVETHTGD